jgi:hypothetical protein
VIIKLYLFGLYSALEQSCTLVKLLNNLACLGTYLFVIYCCVYDSVILMWPGGQGCARGWRARAQLPARDGLRARARAQGLARGRGFVNPLPVGNAPVAIYRSDRPI